MVTEAYINDATVEAVLYDSNSTPIDGQAWPLTLAYVADSDGVYRAVLENTLALIAGHYYQLSIDVAGDDLTAHFETDIQAIKRRF